MDSLLGWTNQFSVDVSYSRNWMKNIEILDSDTYERDDHCIACNNLMNPLLRIANRSGVPVLEKKVCLSCGYSHFIRMPTRKWFENYYSSDWDTWRRSDKSPKSRVVAGYQPNLAKLIEMAPNLDSTILDIGAGFGGFLTSAQKLGYKNLYGLEASEHRSLYCREALGLNVITATVENCLEVLERSRSTRLFDVIHSNHVLEHVYDIDEAISNIHQLLKPGGSFLNFVPFWLHTESIINMAHFLGHVRHFTPESFTLLLQKHGFKVDYVDEQLCVIGRKSGDRITKLVNSRQSIDSNFRSRVEKKLTDELFAGNLGAIEEIEDSTRFWLAGSGTKFRFSLDKQLSFGEFLKWRIKKFLFGVCYNDQAIRGPAGSLVRIFNPRLLLTKLLVSTIFFDRIEMGGQITSNSSGSTSTGCPMVEFRYPLKGAIGNIK